MAIFAGFFLGLMLVYLTRVDAIASFTISIFPRFSRPVLIFVLTVVGFFGIPPLFLDRVS